MGQRRYRIADRLNQVNKHFQLEDNPYLQPAFPQFEGKRNPDAVGQNKVDLAREAREFITLWEKFKKAGYLWHAEALNKMVMQLGHLDRALKKFHDIQVKTFMGQGFKLRNLMRRQERESTSVTQILKTATEDFVRDLRGILRHLGIVE